MLVGKDWKDFQSCFSSIFGENFSVLLLTFLPMNQRIIDGTFGQRLENIQGYDHVVRFLILLGTYSTISTSTSWPSSSGLRGRWRTFFKMAWFAHMITPLNQKTFLTPIISPQSRQNKAKGYEFAMTQLCRNS
jgi:hypothetical protein